MLVVGDSGGGGGGGGGGYERKRSQNVSPPFCRPRDMWFVRFAAPLWLTGLKAPTN